MEHLHHSLQYSHLRLKAKVERFLVHISIKSNTDSQPWVEHKNPSPPIVTLAFLNHALIYSICKYVCLTKALIHDFQLNHPHTHKLDSTVWLATEWSYLREFRTQPSMVTAVYICLCTHLLSFIMKILMWLKSGLSAGSSAQHPSIRMVNSSQCRLLSVLGLK